MFLETLPGSRIRFFALRLALTALFLLLVAGIACLAWYPGLLLQLSGISRHLLVAGLASIVIGPGLSTLLYRHGKRGLALDLIVILVVEVAVLTVVAGDLYRQRPYFAVFVVDRFELVTASEVEWDSIRHRELRDKPFGGPRLVYAKLPEDRATITALIEETVLNGSADIDRRPEFWLPYADGVEAVRERLIPFDRNSVGALVIDAWLKSEELDAGNFGYLPIRGRTGDASIVVDRLSGSPVTILDFDPWQLLPPEDHQPARDIEQTHQ